MTNQPVSQSQKRYQESLGSLFANWEDPELLFITSSTDVGVERNGGRNGSRLGPNSLLSYFKKLNRSSFYLHQRIKEIEVANEKSEREDFKKAQDLEAKLIQEQLLKHPQARICHLGGGHDHIYPWLKAVTAEGSPVVVINIDAHADTRTDPEPHSGNPFRIFSNETKTSFKLYQIGLNPFANATSTTSSLANGNMSLLWRNQLSSPSNIDNFFQMVEASITPDTKVIFSLDADALDGSIMPGVSAVNGNGINLLQLSYIWKKYAALKITHPPYLGIYEFNPVYDSLSGLSARTLANFIYEAI